MPLPGLMATCQRPKLRLDNRPRTCLIRPDSLEAYQHSYPAVASNCQNLSVGEISWSTTSSSSASAGVLTNAAGNCAAGKHSATTVHSPSSITLVVTANVRFPDIGYFYTNLIKLTLNHYITFQHGLLVPLYLPPIQSIPLAIQPYP